MNTILGVLAASVAAVGFWTLIPGGAWEPQATTMQDMRVGLKVFVEQQALKEKVKLAEWQTYTFQFQGQEKKGQRFIFINAYCTKPDSQFSETQMLLVFDGGPCFFNVKYDPKKKAYFELLFNGEA
jgi:hypothetical protein